MEIWDWLAQNLGKESLAQEAYLQEDQLDYYWVPHWMGEQLFQ